MLLEVDMVVQDDIEVHVQTYTDVPVLTYTEVLTRVDIEASV